MSDNANISNVDKYMLSTVFNGMMCSISNIGVRVKGCCDAEEKHFHDHDSLYLIHWAQKCIRPGMYLTRNVYLPEAPMCIGPGVHWARSMFINTSE